MLDRTTRTIAGALPLLAVVAACESSLTVVDVAVDLAVSPPADTLPLGTTATPFRAIALNLEGDTVEPDLRWSVLNPAIGGVDSVSGAITALSPGETRVVVRAGSLADTATLTVLGPVTLGLALDTILLAPGDTFTVPRVALGAMGQPISASFAGTDPAIAAITTTGFVQAVAAGRTSFTMTAESVSVAGVIDVAAVDDTLDGAIVAVLRGDLQARLRLPSRWFQYPTGAGGSVLNLAARNAANTERVLGVLRDGLSAPGVRVVDQFPEVDATTAVCNPPNGWLVYQDRRTGTVDALSVQNGGTVLVQRVDSIPGGFRVSATLNVTLRRSGGGLVTLYGRFVGPLIGLGACPG